MWYIHILSGVLVLTLAAASVFPSLLPVWVLIPLGLLAAWCLFVSCVRAMREIYEADTIDELIEKIKED